MRALSFGFRDYAVHLFPGCLTISAFLFLFLDFTWVTPSFAPLLALLYLIGGYLAGFFIDTITAVLVRKKYIWKISGGDPLRDYFKGVHLKGSPRDLKDCAAQILLRDYGESFVRKQEFKELMYLMMRSVEAANERSAAFLSRINALENMAVNTGISGLKATTKSSSVNPLDKTKPPAPITNPIPSQRWTHSARSHSGFSASFLALDCRSNATKARITDFANQLR